MGKIITKNGIFSFEEIKKTIPSSLGEYERNSILFCHEWLTGKETFILSTSGSTGLPKPIELSRMQMEASALATSQALGLESGDKAIVCLNTAYIAGTMMLVRGMVTGMDLFLVEPSSDVFNEIDSNERIDFIALAPVQLHIILKKNTSKDLLILNAMKAILLGGAAVSYELEQMIQLLKAPVYLSYGMTETVSHIALRKLNGQDKQNYYRTLPDVMIEKDDRGCLKINSKVTNHHWVQTNDVVEILNDKEFLWLGRIDNIINSGGIKLQPEKIESIIGGILQQNGYHEYFLTALSHPTLGEALTLFIEGKDPQNNILKEKLKLILDKYENPRAIIYSEAFMRTQTNKIDRKNTIEPFLRYYLNN